MRGLLARRGTGVLAVAAGWSRRWALGCACCGQPRATAAAGLVAARACCCATFRSLAERGAAFLARSARSMSAALSRRSLCAQRPAGGASFRSRPRRGSSPTRPPGEGCVADPSLALTPSTISLHIERPAWRCELVREAIKAPVEAPGSRGCANRAGRTASSPRAACAAASRRLQPNAIAEKHHGSGALGPHRRRGEARPARVLRDRRLRSGAAAALRHAAADAAARRGRSRKNKAAAAPAPREGARLPPPQTERGQELPARVAPTVGAVRRRVVARRL